MEYDTYQLFAREVILSLLKSMEILKQLFVINQQVEGTTEQKSSSLLEKAFVFLSEGADFTYEKVFETPHPYPKGEYVQKDQISLAKVLAYSVELDKKCSTESNNDYCIIQSLDHLYWINDTFGTYLKFFGKPQVKSPVLILGNKINIEFRSYPHGKRN